MFTSRLHRAFAGLLLGAAIVLGSTNPVSAQASGNGKRPRPAAATPHAPKHPTYQQQLIQQLKSDQQFLLQQELMFAQFEQQQLIQQQQMMAQNRFQQQILNQEQRMMQQMARPQTPPAHKSVSNNRKRGS